MGIMATEILFVWLRVKWQMGKRFGRNVIVMETQSILKNSIICRQEIIGVSL